MKAISTNRWNQAQAVEVNYWDRVATDSEEFLRILHEKYVFLNKIKKKVPDAVSQNGDALKVLEIGIGSLGIGVASLLDPPKKWNITGIEPLPKNEHVNLPAHLSACFKEINKIPLSYIQSPAETYNQPKSTYHLIFCYNVLDHTQDPQQIIRNVYDLLVPGGYFCLGLDTLSLASRLRQKLFPRTYYDPAHPFRFTAWDMENILHIVPFEVVWFEKTPYELLRRICAKARRLIAVCKKP